MSHYNKEGAQYIWKVYQVKCGEVLLGTFIERWDAEEFADGQNGFVHEQEWLAYRSNAGKRRNRW